MNARKLRLLLLASLAVALAGCVHYEPASPYYAPYYPDVPTPWADLPPIFGD
jgi:hypothetical protein